LAQGPLSEVVVSGGYCGELEDISDLKIFLNASAGHWKLCGIFTHPCYIPLVRNHCWAGLIDLNETSANNKKSPKDQIYLLVALKVQSFCKSITYMHKMV